MFADTGWKVGMKSHYCAVAGKVTGSEGKQRPDGLDHSGIDN